MEVRRTGDGPNDELCGGREMELKNERKSSFGYTVVEHIQHG